MDCFPDDQEEMLEIRAVEIAGSHIGDVPVRPDLLSQIPENQEIGSVMAAGANDARKCHDAIADRGAHAASGILSDQWRSCLPPAPQEHETLEDLHSWSCGAQCGPAGMQVSRLRTLAKMDWYHRRSRVGRKMHCVKLLGKRLLAKDFDRQGAELQVRIALLNGYTAPGIPVTEAVE